MNFKNLGIKIEDDAINSKARNKLIDKNHSSSSIDESEKNSENEESSEEELEGTFARNSRRNKSNSRLEEEKKQSKNKHILESEDKSEDDQDDHPHEYTPTDLETDFEKGTFVRKYRVEPVSFRNVNFLTYSL